MAKESDPTQPPTGPSPDDAEESSTPVKVVRIIDKLQPVPVELKDMPKQGEPPPVSQPPPPEPAPEPPARKPIRPIENWPRP